MGGAEREGDRTEIARMQAGIRAWVRRAASGSTRGLRRIPPPALLSMLCASAFSPLISVSTGLTGAAAGAAFTVLSSVSGGALSGILTRAFDRAHAHDGRPAPASAELEQELAAEISSILEAGGADAQALGAEIAAVLTAIDAGRAMLQAAIETGNDQVRRDLIAAVDVLGTGFAQMEFLISDVAQAATEVQRSLDEQAAAVRVVVDQNNRQSADIRLVREDLGVIERRTRPGISGGAGGEQGPRWVHGCPYRGLEPFTEADAEVFYGRERLTAELVVQVARGGLMVVTGASGAGKSSLLRAGLLPALARGIQIEGSERWPRIVITPTRHPMTELATQLAALSGGDAVAGRESLARQPGQAHLAVRQAVLAGNARRSQEQSFSIRDATRLVLVVDQFEQVFTLNPGPDGEAERQAFIAALHAAATSPAGPEHEPPALVVISVRGDFWDRCAAYPELAAALQDRQFVVGPMTETDLRLAITGPAEAAGLRIDPALTETILSDLRAAGGHATAGALPLLSQAMLLTWENRDGDTLTSRGYGKAGGVSRAVQTSADAVYDSLPTEQQMLARELLRAMTVGSRDGRFNRRPVSRAALHAAHPGTGRPQVDAVLEAFADSRLVVLDGDAAQISHDALLAAWPRLRGWLDADQASWILHGQLTDDAATWHDSNKDSSFLYRGTQLAALRQAAAGWESDPARFPAITPGQRDFLQASEHAAARSSRQRRTLAGLLVILLIASVAGAALAAATARSANRQRSAAVSGQLAAESEALDSADPVTASLLAAAAWRIAPTAAARDSMLDVIAQPDHGVLPEGSYISGVVTLAFSPDGKTLATASGDGTIRLWDTATHHQIGAPIGADSNVDTVAFSPDGKTLATASWDGEAQLWNVATHSGIGAPLTTGSTGSFSGTQAVNQDSAAFSPNGKILATVSAQGAAWLWDVAARARIGRPFTTSTGRITAVAFEPGSKTLATASSGGTVQLWNAATHSPVGAPISTGGGADAVTFSPDGKTLATAGSGGTVRLWNVASHVSIGTPLTTSGGSGSDTAAAFSHDGKTLAIASGAGTTRLWDVATHSPIGAPLTTSSLADAVAFSPDGKTLATTGQGGTARLWDLAVRGQIGGPLTADTGRVHAIAFSPDGKTLATAGEDGRVRLWDLATHTQIGLLSAGSRITGGVPALAFSPDGKTLATIDTHGFHVKNTNIFQISDTIVRLWDLASRSQIGAPLSIGSAPGGAVAFSPDGKTLATVSGDGVARLWDVATHQLITALTGGNPSVGLTSRDTVAFSPDGKTLATGSTEGTVRLWNLATGTQIGALSARGDDASFTRVGFSPDGKTLATWGDPGTPRMWNVATHTQKIGVPLSTGTGQVNAMAFSPDGETLATADLDGTARVWDVATHAQIGPPLTIGTPVYAVAFSPDGRTLATESAGGIVRLWNITLPGHILKAVCAIAGRSLTRQEWNTYIRSEPFQRVCP